MGNFRMCLRLSAGNTFPFKGRARAPARYRAALSLALFLRPLLRHESRAAAAILGSHSWDPLLGSTFGVHFWGQGKVGNLGVRGI